MKIARDSEWSTRAKAARLAGVDWGIIECWRVNGHIGYTERPGKGRRPIVLINLRDLRGWLEKGYHEPKREKKPKKEPLRLEQRFV